jgi:surface protein
MQRMFYNCSSLTSIDLSNFDTSKVEYMNGLFYNCQNLEYINLLNFTDISIQSKTDMFWGIKKNAVICIDKNKAPSIYDLANKMDCVSISCRPDWWNVQYKINEEGKCIINCSSTNNRYEYNGKCYDKCDSNCKTCYYEENIPSSNCSSCYENKYLKNGKCVDDCKSDSDYQYEFKHTCYQECPYNISVKSETKDFYCEAKCSKEYPFEIIETQTCVSSCSITQSESGICKINYISEDENNKEVEEKAV